MNYDKEEAERLLRASAAAKELARRNALTEDSRKKAAIVAQQLREIASQFVLEAVELEKATGVSGFDG